MACEIIMESTIYIYGLFEMVMDGMICEASRFQVIQIISEAE